jgi:signal peptidase II
MSAPAHSDTRWLYLGAFLPLLVLVDQVTKQLADRMLGHRPDVVTVVDGFFMLRYARNRGAFFSMGETLPDAARIGLFVGATTIAVGFMVWLYRRAQRDQGALKWALLLFMAGALGNLVDRVVYGEVIDFLHLHYQDVFHWATFNVADIYICAGLVLLLVDTFRLPRRAVDPLEKAESS